eukprot:366228-Chlamydomonas_euryale.AAC.36
MEDLRALPRASIKSHIKVVGSSARNRDLGIRAWRRLLVARDRVAVEPQLDVGLLPLIAGALGAVLGAHERHLLHNRNLLALELVSLVAPRDLVLGGVDVLPGPHDGAHVRQPVSVHAVVVLVAVLGAQPALAHAAAAGVAGHILWEALPKCADRALQRRRL